MAAPAARDSEGSDPTPEVIPTQEACPACGGLLRAVVDPSRIVLRCGDAPTCDFARILRKKDQVPTDRTCPGCGAQMILRSGHYGAFLGCARYPKCRKTIPVGRRR